MPTIRLVPSSYGRSSTTRVAVTNPENMYYNTDHTSAYCSIRGRNSTSSTYYAFINGFNFDDVPANAVVSSFVVKIRCYRNTYQQTGSTYRLRLASSASNNSVISGTTMSEDIGTTADVYAIPTGDLTWSQLKNYGSGFSIEIPLRPSSSQYPYVYVYGAEIEVTYTAETVHPTGVSVSPSTASVEAGSTVQLTETVTPSNATDKSVSWSSSNTAVATVDSNGLVTGISAGSATITATTNDGGLTATCAVTVTPVVLTDYVQTSSLQPGKSYLIVNGNTGSVYMLSNESGGSRQLKGVQATISNGKISISASVAAKCLFECQLYTVGDPLTTCLASGGGYLYSDNASGLRIYTSPNNKHWHYTSDGNKLWMYRGDTDGYTDATSEFKYYLEISGGNYTDAHVTTTSIEDSSLPPMFLFTEDTGGGNPPVITVGTPSRTIISDESGYDQCICAFRSDLDLQAWEARATKSGTTPARGVGLLVESGTTLAANTDATIYVDNEELTNGDGEYTITVYGQSTGGVWSG